jgi:NHLM bacteriocin system ABC transporter ATP-binding protein
MDAFDLSQRLAEEGVVQSADGNAPFMLEDPASAWLVESGRVDLFSVQCRDGQPLGGRSHFCSVETGGLLIGMPIEQSGANHGLLAVGLLHTQLRAFPLARLRELASHSDWRVPAAQLIDQWLVSVSAGVSRDTNPRTDVLLEPSAKVTIPSGRNFRSARGVQWIDAAGGDLLFVGMEEVDGVDRRRLCPVTQDAWLQTLSATEVTAHATEDVISEDGLWRGLEFFGETVCKCEAVNRRLNHVDEFNRTQDRLDGGRREVGAALADLVGVLEEVSDEFDSPIADPLFLACHVVGRHQSIAVTAPAELARGETVADPLDAIARASQLRMRRVKLNRNWWTSDGGPFVAFLADGHRPVALLPTSTRAYELHDPRDRTRRRVTADVAATIEPAPYVLYRSFKDDVVSGWELLRFGSRGRARDVARLVSGGAVARLLAVLPALATGLVIDRVIPGGRASELVELTLALVALAAAAAAFEMLRDFSVQRIEGWMNHELQAGVMDRLLKLPITFFRDYNSGDLAARALGINQIRQTASLTMVTVVLANLFAAFDLALLFYLDARLALVASVLLAGALVLTLMLGLTQVRRQRRVAEEQGRVGGFVLQLLTGISKLRVAGAEMLAFAMWARKFARQKQLAFDARRSGNAVAAVNALVPVLIMAVLFALMARTRSDELSTGMFLVFITALGSLIASTLAMTAGVINTLQVVPLFERMRPILETAPELTHARPDPGVFSGRLELSRVTFRYSADTPVVLDDVTLDAQPGEFIAIVGPSGSGKSTLMRLLLGFDKPMSGVVQYDGKDLWEFDLTAVRRQIGVVLQSSRLMPGDIFSNIAGSLTLTMEDAWRAARLAGLEAEIRALPMGMQTIIPPGGGGLSGGQRQRVLIARAMASRPRIVLLDEATSALDNRTQSIVGASLDDLQATRVVIAHRLSTIARADRIYVMDGGKVVQRGTYQALMDQPGLFRDLATRQLAGDPQSFGAAAGA